MEFQVKGESNRYLYKFSKSVVGGNGNLCRGFEVDENSCELVDLGWGLFDKLEVDYDDVANSWEFWMSTNNLNQLLSGVCLV